jgi:trk system potassium uptake protein TrkA
MIASTGDDKVNLVVSLLAKTEYGVPRVVARVNHPSNEWMFDESWGVDVSVSTPRILSALVEEAVSIGDVVRLFTLRHGNANLVELTLPADSPVAEHEVGSITWPQNSVLITIVRGNQVITPSPEDTLEAGDELLFISSTEAEAGLQALLAPH